MNPEPTLDEPTELLVDKIDVTLTALLNGGRIEWSWKNDTHPGSGELKVGKGKNGKLVFRIDNKTGKTIRFDASGPIFYVENPTTDDCPTSFPAGGDLMVESCDADLLTLIDWNTVAGEIRYQVNFVTNSGGSVPPLDPVIINGGGGIKPFISN
jgi:hypothetical protein